MSLHFVRGEGDNGRDESGESPSMIAAAANRASIGRLLIEAGAEDETLDSDGKNALPIAIASGAIEAIGEASDFPIEIVVVAEGGEGIGAEVAEDMDDWAVEPEPTRPLGSIAATTHAKQIQKAISEFVPAPAGARWGEVAFALPIRIAPKAEIDEDRRAERKNLLLRALREGSVPGHLVEDASRGDANERDEEAEAILRLVINDCGAEVDDRHEYSGPNEDFRVAFASGPSKTERAALDEALDYYDGHVSAAKAPIQGYIRGAQRQRLIAAAEEVALAQAMEKALAQALDVLAAWPCGIAQLLVSAAEIKTGRKTLSWLVAESREDIEAFATPEDSDFLPVATSAIEADQPTKDEASLDLNAGEGEFLARINELAKFSLSTEASGEQWKQTRAALERIGIKSSFLVDLASQAGTASPPAAFLEAMTAYREASHQLTMSNLRLVTYCARRYLNSEMPYEDLIQEGNLGLMKAVERFDWRRGFKFSTFAMWWIRQAISRSVANDCRTIRVPVHFHDSIYHAQIASKKFERETGRLPSSTELASILSMPVSKVEALFRADEKPVPIDSLGVEESIAPEAPKALVPADPSAAAEARELRVALESMMERLPRKAHEILRMRFGFDNEVEMKLAEIGYRLDVTRERIRQVEAKALRNLKNASNALVLGPWLAPLKEKLDPFDLRFDSRAESDETEPEDDLTQDQPPTTEPVSKHDSTLNLEPPLIGAKTRPEAKSPYPRTVSRPTALAELMRDAKQLGIQVDDQREWNGRIWVRVHANNDTKTRVLIRKLIEMGFSYEPGEGYRK